MSARRLGMKCSAVMALLAATTVALPAQAAECPQSTPCPTTVSFNVDAPNGLTITVPTGTVNIGSGIPGAQISGSLGVVTVSDGRAQVAATWNASVVAAGAWTGTTHGGTIPATDVLYWSGTATATTGLGTFQAGQPTSGDAQSLDVSRFAYRHLNGDGVNSATWNPTIVVNVPATVVADTYSGTVNHSVG